MLRFGILLSLAGIILLIAGLAQYAQNRSFTACSENIAATITRKRKRNVNNSVSYELTASYTVNGSPYEKTVGATKSRV